MIKISVITCTYNAAATIERTLRSVATQDYPAVEHIIIDGLSSDATLPLVRRYAEEVLRRGAGHSVVVHSERDDGLYFAMNKGLRAATGDYVLFLNAGDTLADDHTLSAVAAVATSAAALPGVLYGDTDIVGSDGTFLRHRRLQPTSALTWRSFRRGMLVCHQAFYALTSLAQATPYDTHFLYSADIDWCIRVMKTAAQQGKKIVAVPQVVAHYLAGGLTTSHHRASLAERFAILRRHYGLLSCVANHLWFVVRAVVKR